jgi:hypothetical protein
VYSFQDVLALRTFVRLREHASLQKIRGAIGNLRDIGEGGHLASYRLVSDSSGNIQLVTEDQATQRRRGVLPMPLSLFWSCCGAYVFPGQDGVGEFDGGRGVVAGAVLAGFPDGIMVVAGTLDDAGVAALAPFVQVPGVGDAGHDAGEGALALVRPAGLFLLVRAVTV